VCGVGVRGESAGMMIDGIETRADVGLWMRPVSTLYVKVEESYLLKAKQVHSLPLDCLLHTIETLRPRVENRVHVR